MKPARGPSENELHARLNAFLQADAESETANDDTIRNEAQRLAAGIFAAGTHVPNPKATPRLRRALSALGGAHSQILARAPVDAAEMPGRGIAALIPAVFGGLAAIIACKYAYSLPLAAAAAAGAGWAAVVLCFDVSLMRAAPDRRSLSRLVTIGLRVIVSVLAAFIFSSAIVMFMFSRGVASQVATDQQTGLARYNSTVIVPAYAAKITADQDTITADQGKITQADQAVASWQQQVANAALQATCEKQGVSQFAGCGAGTGLAGQGPVYAVRVAELGNDQAALARAQAQAAATRARLSPQIAAAQAGLFQAKADESADYAAAKTRYGQDDGLIARWRALGELEAASPGARTEVWLLEGLIIAIDLAAVITKLTSKTLSYNHVLIAMRGKAGLHAAMSEEDAGQAAELRRAELKAQADIHQAQLDAQVHVASAAMAAWTEVAQRRIRAWADQQTGGQQPVTAGADGGLQPPPYHGGQRESGVSDAVPVKGHSLADLVDCIRPHEQMPVAMAPPLRRVAWIGVGLLAALGTAMLVAQAAHLAVAGGWLILLALAPALALAAYSRGFRRGPAWVHRAAFTVGLVGLGLPVVIALVNV
jgi:hypothetical protein